MGKDPLTAASKRTQRRVLLVVPQPFYQDRGTPIALRYLLQALTELGYGVDVLAFALGQPIELPGVRYIRVGHRFGFRSVPVGFSLRKLVLDGRMAWVCHRLLTKYHYQAVHGVEESAFFVAALARKTGTPVIYDMASSLPEQLADYRFFSLAPVQRWLQRMERWLLHHVDGVACSAGLAARVKALAPDTSVQEWIFPADAPAATEAQLSAWRLAHGIPATGRVVMYCGTFARYQGIHDLVAAVRPVLTQCADAHFVLIGADGKIPDLIQTVLGDSLATTHVWVLERQPREAVNQLLGVADILVSPRRYGANLPLKVFDYLAAGKPIVATDIPAHRTVLDSSRAVLVPPGAEGLVQGIVHLLEDPESSARLGANGRIYAREHCSWAQYVTRVGGIYAMPGALST